MQTLLSPATCSGVFTATGPYLSYPQWLSLWTFSRSLNPIANPSLPPPKSVKITHQSLPFQFLKSHDDLRIRPSSLFSSRVASSSISSGYTSPTDDSSKIAQVAKRLEKTSRSFKRFGSLGFWCQLVCAMAAVVILSFSVVKGKISSHGTFFAISGGIAAAFVSVFSSLEYITLAEKLKRMTNDPTKAPPRADIMKSLKNSLVVNILGIGISVLAMQVTVGSFVAKALTTKVNPYFPGATPVRAIDVFLVQASVNTILSHFLGIIFSLVLLRSVT